MSDADCEGTLSEAESVKSEAEANEADVSGSANEPDVSSSANEPDVSSSANEPELSLLDDILSVESGGSASILDGISNGAGQQQREVASSNINSIMLFASWSASSAVACAFLL
jgi:hypothetical protein